MTVPIRLVRSVGRRRLNHIYNFTFGMTWLSAVIIGMGNGMM